MPPRLKKLVGFAIFLPALAAYVFAAAALGVKLPDNQLLKVSYYLLAGVAWALPAKHLMQWMNAAPSRPRRRDRPESREP